MTPDINAITTIIIALVVRGGGNCGACVQQASPGDGVNSDDMKVSATERSEQRALGTWSGGRSLPGVLYQRSDDLCGARSSGSSSSPGSTSGTQSQIPQRGDYFLFEIAGESVIVVRDERRRRSTRC